MPSRRAVIALPFCGLPLLKAQQSGLSTLIKGSRIADGTGAALREGDVRVSGDRIAEIGKLTTQPGDRLIDGRGLALAPGFIDLHNHSTAIDRDPSAATQVSQGITTVLLGQDGSSPWPIKEWLDARREHPAALNLQLMAGHATIRRKVMGDDYKRTATAEEIAAMAKLVDTAMTDGAVGLSSGLEYEVGSYSNLSELVEMARAAAPAGAFTFPTSATRATRRWTRSVRSLPSRSAAFFPWGSPISSSVRKPCGASRSRWWIL
jgi:N-acyl-D-amino-acid deacylase